MSRVFIRAREHASVAPPTERLRLPNRPQSMVNSDPNSVPGHVRPKLNKELGTMKIFKLVVFMLFIIGSLATANREAAEISREFDPESDPPCQSALGEC